MKQNVVVSIAAIGGMVVCGVCWLLVPTLQGTQRKVDTEASLHLETARRLVQKYSFGLEYKSLLLDRLAASDVDTNVDDPDALVEDEDTADEYQAGHAERWKTYEPTDWSQSPRPATARYGNLPGQINDGITARIDLINENQEWLQRALAEVERALSISHGDASSGSHAQAQRLKAVILYQQGIAERLASISKRSEAEPYRRELVSLAPQMAALQSTTTLVADSGIDAQIEELEKRLSENEGQVRRRADDLAKLDATIQDFQARIATAEARALTARTAMSELQARGIDFSDPAGPATFNQEFIKQDQTYRDAEREVRSLRAGYYPHAQIDHTGDFLRGRYIESGSPANLTVEPGLQRYRGQRVILASEISEQEQAVEDLRSGIARMAQTKTSYEQAQTDAVRQIGKLADSAEKVYEEFERIVAEAEAFEETAIELFEKSARVAAKATSDSKTWIADAREHTRGLSPEAKARSALEERTTDDWMNGAISAEEADARIAIAQIHYTRYDAGLRDADLLESVSETLGLKEVEVEDLRLNAEEARNAGVEEVLAAVELLKQAHSAMDKHWTVVAQEAGALYLLSQLGESDYLADSIEAYRSAVKGREDSGEVEKFAARLKRLENR